MRDKHIKALIKEVLQEENLQRTKALQKESAMQEQMYIDYLTTGIGGAILSFITVAILLLGGFTFLTGVLSTLTECIIGVVIYMSIKADNETREMRVNKMLKQVN